jgi:phosphate transport system permease protein
VGPDDGQPVPAAAGEVPAAASVARPARRSGRGRWAYVTSPIALIPLGIVAAVAIVLLVASHLEDFGASFWSFNYDFVPGEFGASSWGVGAFVLGTGITAGLALLLATLLSLALSISIVVYLPSIPSRILAVVTNLLAGIPSVVYGIWGFVILAPYFGLVLEPSLRDALAWLPGFGGPTSAIGPSGILLAVFILTIMIIPLTTALMRDALRSVPKDLVEAGLALGATRWEVARRVRMNSARRGIWGAILLGFGRAVGESVAVAMVIGAVPKIPPSIYAPSTTLASYIFYQLDSAFVYPNLLKFLVEVALLLLAIAIAVNVIAQRLTHTEVATATLGGGGGGR